MSPLSLPSNSLIWVTGSAGFIGYHLAKSLLEEGCSVIGFDGFTDYYDVSLKRDRHEILSSYDNFTAIDGFLEDADLLQNSARKYPPDIMVHLAAQAGVRYSLQNPRAYLQSNLVGAFNVLEVSREAGVRHLLCASSSSVYGNNSTLPFKEGDATNTPLSLYAATKIANESLGYSYAHSWGLSTTMMRFFTVYGPWGRPDMALFKFVDAMLSDACIDVFNDGNMARDFTYVADVVRAIRLLMQLPPGDEGKREKETSGTLNTEVPFRAVNIGNASKIALTDFIGAIERVLNVRAKKSYRPMQLGDVRETSADVALLESLIGYRPSTDIEEGVGQFINWYRAYYKR
ncbi:NAD-dependent epimerase/dehydratase family protein [Luminiphilus sp.]|nr:NAD-dependent epimerase/dehydratase family protein [Luminiphilus sp.]